MDDLEQLSYEESKRQTKERRERGKNMIRPFTFDEEKKICYLESTINGARMVR